MSSLIYYIDPKQAMVVTDTLVGDFEGNPIHYATKAFYVSHQRLIVACTGLNILFLAWMQRLNSGVQAEGIEELNTLAPDELCKTWEQVHTQFHYPKDKTATVYHFGVSERSQDIVAFAYRSANEFRSEPLANCIGVKPKSEVQYHDGDFMQLIRPIMEDQRRIQSEKPISERLLIGGEAIAIHLTAEGCTHNHLFRFDGYDAA